MTDRTHPDSGSTHIIRYALEMGLLWIDGDGRDKVREALDALDILEAELEAVGAGGVEPLRKCLHQIEEPASLAASAGSEPVATVFTMEALAPGGGVKYHATVHKPLPAGTKLYTNPSPPEGMVGGWIASKDQMPPPGVRVFWGDVDSNRVGYDSWAGDDYRWAPSHWMHIPEFPAPPTTSAGSKGE